MKVVILGGGVVGVTTAYFLARKGARVQVLEEKTGSAMQCSYANGAQLSYSHASPWATYANVMKGIKWLGKKDAPLLLRPRLDLEMYRWIIKFLSNCRGASVERNTHAILALNFYSKMVLEELVVRYPELSFNYSNNGILHVFKTQHEVDECERLFAHLQSMEATLDFRRLTADGCVEVDPALSHMMNRRAGGVLCAADSKGDAYKFTQELTKECKKLGVEFHYGTEIFGLGHSASRVKYVTTEFSKFDADMFVVALGACSGSFLRSYGIDLPIYPMKGYSVSAKIKNKKAAPRISITDQERKVVFTKIGGVLRAAGTAEFAGYDREVLSERIVPIITAMRTNFPEASDYREVTSWACLRAQTPHSYPYISRVRFNNLFINSGHGSLGWTQSAGSAKMLADIVVGDKPEIDITPYTITS